MGRMRDDTLRRLRELARETERLARQVERELREGREGPKDEIVYNAGDRERDPREGR
jgi:hypothetical protein